MLIKSVIIENFRGYSMRQTIDFSDFTAFVGKNDVGKSTVLEALDIFFNEGAGIVKIDSEDINMNSKKSAGGNNVDIVIGVSFKNVPESVMLDDNNETSLADEFLLDDNQTLTILKRYPNGGKQKVFIYANHPSHPDCKDLLLKKQADLRKLTQGLSCDRNKNAEMRAAIRQQHSEELNLQLQEIDVSKEDAKNIWEKLKSYMPVYSLFQADRSNGDKDKEIQDPLKEAVKQIFASNEIKNQCKTIYETVIRELQSVSNRTLQKINEMNPELATSLHPSMPKSEELKWIDVFKSVAITGENDIPLNKRGSGVKRMVLLNFFRAEAERVQQIANAPGIIYAIEEPETAQHVDHQMLLINSLKNIAEQANSQIIITTHSSDVVKALTQDMIRVIVNRNQIKQIAIPHAKHLPYISLNEINYTVYDMPGIEYHNELYGYLQAKAIDEDNLNEREGNFERWLVAKGLTQNKMWIRLKGGVALQPQPATLQTYIRNFIHHPENTYNAPYNADELKQSINSMVSIIDSLN